MNKKLSNNGICREAAESSILQEKGPARELRLLAEWEQAALLKSRSSDPEIDIITEFDRLPSNRVFSENTYYNLFNRANKMEFVINGRVLEGKIGLDSVLYEQVKNRSVKVFEVDGQIVRFYQARGGYTDQTTAKPVGGK